MKHVVLSFAAAAAILCCEIPPSVAQNYGEAPWCAVINLGVGDVKWECYYRTAAECAPNVIAGDRGFCNINPYYTASSATPRHTASRQRKRHAHS